MKKIFRSLKLFAAVILCIIAQYIFILPQLSSAFAADYSVSYDITYTIHTDGSTTVDYHIDLTNLTNNVYADSQSLTVTQTDLSNISVIGEDDIAQSFSVNKSTSATELTTTFSAPAIGTNSVDDWNISYTTNQVAIKQGHVWNILVPGFGDKQSLNISDIHIHIIAPSSFGSISYSSPIPSSVQTQSNQTDYSFTSDQINTSGINMTLGGSETYSFSFNYPISNTSSSTQLYTIAVPFDSATQQITFTTLTPKPEHFSIDNDGNYILSYSLSAHMSGTIAVSGLATVEGTYSLLSQKKTQPVYLSAQQQSAFTSGGKYWQTTNPTIQKLAASLTKADTTNIAKAQSIYTYLVQNFTYNRNALYDKNRQRKGALYAIEHPTDVICQEYVDAFVALARSAGVPAVFDAGYGSTISPFTILPPNVLHAWAQFYDPNYGWVPVDPTWGSTSGLNFFGNIGTSHFAIAQYGYSSDTPELVQAFVATGNQDNNIQFSPSEKNIQPQAAIEQISPSNVHINAGISDSVSITLQNTGNQVLYLHQASFDINNTTFSNNQTKDYVFPTMQTTLLFSIQEGSILSNTIYNGAIHASYAPLSSPAMVIFNAPLSVHVDPLWVLSLIPVFAVVLIFMISYTLVNLFIRLHHRFAKK